MKISGSRALLLSVLSFSCLQPCLADPPLPTPVGRVVWVKGTLSAEMENKETRSLQKMSLIYLHDTLVTDTKSQAEIVFTDNTLVTFHQGTKYSVDKYDYKPKAKTGNFLGTLVEGGFRSLTGVIAKQTPQNYQVNTPVSTIGVRGTDYQTFFSKGKLYVRWFQGSPCVKTKDSKDPNKSFELCLDKDHPFGSVPGEGMQAQFISVLPDEMKQPLDIQKATIAPFGTSSGTSSSGGVMSSFCITD